MSGSKRLENMDLRLRLARQMFPDANLTPYPQEDSSLFISPDRSLVVWFGGGRSGFIGLNRKHVPLIGQATTACAVIYMLTDATTHLFVLPLGVRRNTLLVAHRPVRLPSKTNAAYTMHVVQDRSRRWYLKECHLLLRTFEASRLSFVGGFWRRTPRHTLPPVLPNTAQMIQKLQKQADGYQSDPNWWIEVRVIPRSAAAGA